MKTYLLMSLFFFSFIGFSQNDFILKADDGRRVLLKADHTWEYIVTENPDGSVGPINTPLAKDKRCGMALDFVEPHLDNQIQAQLKRGRATINHVKQKVANDFKCEVEDVLLLSASEDRDRGSYDFCANGTTVTYKRNGFTIIKSRKLF